MIFLHRVEFRSSLHSHTNLVYLGKATFRINVILVKKQQVTLGHCCLGKMSKKDTEVKGHYYKPGKVRNTTGLEKDQRGQNQEHGFCLLLFHKV